MKVDFWEGLRPLAEQDLKIRKTNKKLQNEHFFSDLDCMKSGLQLGVEVEWGGGIRLSPLPGSSAGSVSPGEARGGSLRRENWPTLCF